MKGNLWINQNWKLFKEKSQDQLKAKMAESSHFKMYRSELIPCHVTFIVELVYLVYTIIVCHTPFVGSNF